MKKQDGHETLATFNSRLDGSQPDRCSLPSFHRAGSKYSKQGNKLSRLFCLTNRPGRGNFLKSRLCEPASRDSIARFDDDDDGWNIQLSGKRYFPLLLFFFSNGEIFHRSGTDAGAAEISTECSRCLMAFLHVRYF